MASKTQIRVQQLTGSILDLAFSGSQSSAASPAAIVDTDLGAVLGQFAGAIGRISGKTGNAASGFTNASAGTFYAKLKSDSTGNIDMPISSVMFFLVTQKACSLAPQKSIKLLTEPRAY